MGRVKSEKKEGTGWGKYRGKKVKKELKTEDAIGRGEGGKKDEKRIEEDVGTG